MSQRAAAGSFRVSLATVQLWVGRAVGQRLDRVDWADRSSRPTRTTRCDPGLEDLIRRLRIELRETSVLGEYGARAIHQALLEQPHLGWRVPSVRTIGRILGRHDMLDRRRRRTLAPAAGWYLPDVREWRAELDSFDTIEGLKLVDGPVITVLTGISLHGGLVDAWPERWITDRRTCDALVERWTEVGLPAYAQFDNDGRFAGSSSTTDAIGKVIRTCLSMGVTPVFAPPRESGFQASIESFNGRWQGKLWSRHSTDTLAELQAHSARYVAASRQRSAVRIDAAPARRNLVAVDPRDLDRNPAGRLIYLRRTSGSGTATVLGRVYPVDRRWPYRLVRAEVDLAEGALRFFALRRRDPADQPLLREHAYQPPPHWTS